MIGRLINNKLNCIVLSDVVFVQEAMKKNCIKLVNFDLNDQIKEAVRKHSMITFCMTVFNSRCDGHISVSI